jgi:Peptidase family M23/Ricin-type beta-trefoil lectin domain-like
MLMIGGIMKYPKMLIVAAFLMLLASCGQTLQKPEIASPQTRAINSGLSLPIPINETGWVLTSGPHPFLNFCGIGKPCAGNWGSLDFARSGYGSSNVVAMADGVVEAYEIGSGVNCGIRIRHDALGLKTNYFHLLSFAVSPGQTVTRGQVLGTYGSTCGYINGPHLHITIFNASGQEVNIDDYIIGGWQPWRVPNLTYYGGLTKVGGTNPAIGTVLDADTGNNSVINDGTIGSGSSGGCPPNCPTNTLTKEMIGKAGAITALNFNLGDNVFNLFTTNSSDPDQLWDIFKPGDFGSNPGWMMRRKGTNICLNFYRPNLANGVYPNPYACSASDGDQQFDFIDKGLGATGREWQIRVQGTGYCLDTANWASLAQVYAYSCVETPNQHWIIPTAPDPVVVVPPSWSVTPIVMTFTGVVGGAIPTKQGYTLRNSGGAGSYTTFSTDDTWLGLVDVPTLNVAGGSSTTGNTNIKAACNTIGTRTGRIEFRGASGSNSAFIDVTYNCTAALVATFIPSVSSLTLPAGTVGGTASSNTFTLQNTGTASGTYTLNTSSPFTVNPATGALANGSGAPITITVTAAACTVAGTQTSVISIAGSTTTISASRVCTVALPAVPTRVTLNVSSNGRIFVIWNESTGAEQYEFAGTFDTNTPLGFSSGVNARGSGVSGAVLVWGSTPEDPAKQGKQLCVQIRAKNAGGSSNYASPVCTTYKYYTGVSLKSSSPVVTISLP